MWQSPGSPQSPESRKPEPILGSLGFPLKSVRVDGWEGRNNFVRMCVNMGLNGPQIVTLSLSTPEPMRSHQQVYDKIKELNLVRLFQSPKVKRRRAGPHNEGIIELFMKSYGQALEYGYEVVEVMRDECPTPGARFRTDLGFRVSQRLFFWEYQTSKLEHTRWHTKLNHYVKLYEQLGEPFRAVFVLQDELAVTKVRAYARQILLRRHPDLNLFYFITLGQFRRSWDIVKGKVYRGAWDGKEGFSLM